MKSARQIQKRDLKPGYSKLSEGGTRVISLRNNGVDDKFSIVVAAQLIDGRTYSVEIADRLNRGDAREIDISRASVQIIRFSFMWRDLNGLGRWTCTKQSESGKFFLSLGSWWIASTSTTEENFLSGSEIFS